MSTVLGSPVYDLSTDEHGLSTDEHGLSTDEHGLSTAVNLWRAAVAASAPSDEGAVGLRSGFKQDD